MGDRTTGVRARSLSALAIALGAVVLATVTRTLGPTVSTTVAPEPPRSMPPSSGVSILELLYLVISRLLALFGVTLDAPSGRAAGRGLVGVVIVILQFVYHHRLAVVALLVSLTVSVLLFQYRHRLAVPRVSPSSGERTEPTGRSPSTGTTNPAWSPETESQSVRAVWLAMVHRIDNGVEAPSSRTPGEWQRLAVDSGLSPDAVETITEVFCAVRYGNASETDDRRNDARAMLERLDDGCVPDE